MRRCSKLAELEYLSEWNIGNWQNVVNELYGELATKNHEIRLLHDQIAVDRQKHQREVDALKAQFSDKLERVRAENAQLHDKIANEKQQKPTEKK